MAKVTGWRSYCWHCNTQLDRPVVAVPSMVTVRLGECPKCFCIFTEDMTVYRQSPSCKIMAVIV